MSNLYELLTDEQKFRMELNTLIEKHLQVAGCKKEIHDNILEFGHKVIQLSVKDKEGVVIYVDRHILPNSTRKTESHAKQWLIDKFNRTIIDAGIANLIGAIRRESKSIPIELSGKILIPSETFKYTTNND